MQQPTIRCCVVFHPELELQCLSAQERSPVIRLDRVERPRAKGGTGGFAEFTFIE
jgi:hypothetical protein